MNIAALLLIWTVIAGCMILIGNGRRPSAGLPLGYFLNLSLIHTPGAAVYMDFPKWDVLTMRTESGFEQTVIGMVAFLLGVMVARRTASLTRSIQQPKDWHPQELAAVDRLALVYLFGGVCYFMIGSLVAIPSVGALVAQLSSLLIVGISLRFWVARQEQNNLKFWFATSLLPLMPIVTMIRSGFIGFGTFWLLNSVSFAFAQTKQRVGYFLIAPFVVFLGLSVFVNYMAARAEFRRAVWFQQVDISDRVQLIVNMFWNFELLDSENSKHREVIDGRLNQNLIVGAAVDRLEFGAVQYLHGATFTNLAISLIPRALWPDKPQVGGGGTVVRDFAGMDAPEGTSVGAGQVLEFYINFGTWGVIGGFLLYGWLIGWMDLRVMERLNQGDQKGYLLWFMVCLALVQPGGNLVEVVTSAASAAVMGIAFGYLLDRYFSGDKVGQSVQSKFRAM